MAKHEEKTNAPEKEPALKSKLGVPAGGAPDETKGGDRDQAERRQAAAHDNDARLSSTPPDHPDPPPQHAAEAHQDKGAQPAKDERGPTELPEGQDAGVGDIFLEGPEDQMGGLGSGKELAKKLGLKFGGESVNVAGRKRLTFSRN